MMLRRFAAFALVVTAAALSACRDTAGINTIYTTGLDTLVVYSIDSTNVSLPVALNSYARSTVRNLNVGNFDIGFRLNSDSSVDLIPARDLVSSVFGTQQVGITLSSTPFDALMSAPSGYYRPDTTTNVKKGQTWVLLSNQSSTVCYYFGTTHMYAKGVVDSVNMTTRAIYFRHVVDKNCGYRSFVLGQLPAN